MAALPATRMSVLPGHASTDTEEGRSFYQDRLGLFGGCVFLVAGGFYAVGVAMRLMAREAIAPVPIFFWTPQLYHLAGTVVTGALWIGCRRVRLSLPSLRRLDAAGTVTVSICWALMAASFGLVAAGPMAMDPKHSIAIGLLACTYTVLVRAITLPSTPRRTVWISAASMTPIVAANFYVLAARGTDGPMLAFASADVASWGIAGVAVAAVSSRIIFGLRAEAARVRRLGQYALEEKIGEGGMGIVYRARHAMLQRPTAIKLLPPEKVGEASIRRFEREVQLTARLTHPNTIAVFDYGRTPDGLFYYAMEYLDGLNLDQLVREDGPQKPGRVIHLLHQVCGALAEAHGIGLIHGDVKPANILLADRGGVPDVVKVVDFGLVRRFDREGVASSLTVTSGNLLLGTPQYLAPEAIRGEQDLDARSDLYAVGAVGYFLLTGRPVFDAGTVVELLAHHLHTRPVPPSRRTGQPIPAPLEALILRCLEKDPAARPRDARTLQAGLARCPCSVPWSSDEATAWWAAYRTRQQGKGLRVAAAGAEAPTLAVDISARVAR